MKESGDDTDKYEILILDEVKIEDENEKFWTSTEKEALVTSFKKQIERYRNNEDLENNINFLKTQINDNKELNLQVYRRIKEDLIRDENYIEFLLKKINSNKDSQFTENLPQLKSQYETIRNDRKAQMEIFEESIEKPPIIHWKNNDIDLKKTYEASIKVVNDIAKGASLREWLKCLSADKKDLGIINAAKKIYLIMETVEAKDNFYRTPKGEIQKLVFGSSTIDKASELEQDYRNNLNYKDLFNIFMINIPLIEKSESLSNDLNKITKKSSHGEMPVYEGNFEEIKDESNQDTYKENNIIFSSVMIGKISVQSKNNGIKFMNIVKKSLMILN